jgi:hypothetical protein
MQQEPTFIPMAHNFAWMTDLSVTLDPEVAAEIELGILAVRLFLTVGFVACVIPASWARVALMVAVAAVTIANHCWRRGKYVLATIRDLAWLLVCRCHLWVLCILPGIWTIFIRSSNVAFQ